MDRFERAGNAFAELCRVMAKLRGPGGCPWDREQTMESLRTYLLEETYETLEAMSSGDAHQHCEELGDLALQIVFQAEIAGEADKDSFGAAEVVQGITDKLIRRHPHVFGEAKAADAEAVLRQWEGIKAAERDADAGLLDGVPAAMPALLRAYRTGEKAAGVGFDWPDESGARAKFDEEIDEVDEVLAQLTTLSAKNDTADQAAEAARLSKELEAEIGDLLFALVNYARHLEVDPEMALQGSTARFHHRFGFIERHLAELGKTPHDVSLQELDELWQRAKQQ